MGSERANLPEVLQLQTALQLQEALKKYISDTYKDIDIIRDFAHRGDQWEEARQKEIQDIQGDLSELQMGTVLKKTLEGLKDLQNFLEAVERLVVTSGPVFKQNNSVVELPKKIPRLVLSANILGPLLLLFKMDNNKFFEAKMPNKTVIQKQLEIYITKARLLWKGFKLSDLDDINLDPPQIELNNVSEKDVQRMFSRIDTLSSLRADRAFRMLCLFQGDSSKFRQKFSELKPEIEKCLKELEDCAQELDSMNKGAHISGTVSSSMGIAGGALSLLGLFLAPFTAGVSLGLTFAGAGIGVTSGAQSIVTTAVEYGVNGTQNKRAKEAFDKCVDMINKIQLTLNDVIHQHFEELSVNVLKAVLLGMYSGGVFVNNLTGLTDLIKEQIKDAQVAANVTYDVSEGAMEVGKAVSTGVKVAKGVSQGVVRVASGALNGVFAAVDVYFLYSNINSLVKGTETEVSKGIRARSGLCRAMIESWQEIHDLVGHVSLTDRLLLKKSFYP